MNESDPRSDVHYLGSSENKAWKKFQAYTGFEPVLSLKRSKRDKSKQKSNVCRAPLTKICVRTSFSQATYFKGKVKSGRAKNDVSDSL